MSLFVCDECGAVENTGFCRYWVRNVAVQTLEGRALCSECDPRIGKWHGHFPKEVWDGKTKVRNRGDEDHSIESASGEKLGS